MTTHGGDDGYQFIVITDDFEASLTDEGPDNVQAFTDDEVDGILAALMELDRHPTDIPGLVRLHPLQRQDAPWWSITPETPPGSDVRVLVRPERRGNTPVWIAGAVTRHYRARPS